MIKLNNLSTDLKHVTVEYLDIVNYEIARENICGYIFLLSRLSKNAEPTQKMQMESKIQDLIYYRDNLQIEDKDNIQKVLNTLIPEYQAEQNNQTAQTETTTSNVETAVITISMGEGISELFTSMGATHIISGGQTMNPSTEDIVKVIEQSECQRAIILPNNKNIRMSSDQAAQLVKADTVVIPTTSIPQGIAALFQYDVASTLEENASHMNTALETVKSGSITFAVRDTKIDGVDIKKDEFMGLAESKIVTSNADEFKTITGLLSTLLNEESEILTVITGEDAQSDMTTQLEEWVENEYPDVEIEIHKGDQPIYPYLFAVE